VPGRGPCCADITIVRTIGVGNEAIWGARALLVRFHADATLFHRTMSPDGHRLVPTVGSSRSRANSSATARGGSESGSPHQKIDSAHTAQERKKKGRAVQSGLSPLQRGEVG
jgi:hypothetical protein